MTFRFGSSHLTSDGHNKRDEELLAKWDSDASKQTLNSLSKELQFSLRKRTYDFGRAEEAVRHVDRLQKEKSLGPVDDSDIVRLRTDEKKRVRERVSS